MQRGEWRGGARRSHEAPQARWGTVVHYALALSW